MAMIDVLPSHVAVHVWKAGFERHVLSGGEHAAVAFLDALISEAEGSLGRLPAGPACPTVAEAGEKRLRDCPTEAGQPMFLAHGLPPALTPDQVALMKSLAGDFRLTLLTALSIRLNRDPKQVRAMCRELEAMRLLHRPKGERKGCQLTVDGVEILRRYFPG